MSAIDEFLRNNERYAAGFAKGDLPSPPARRIAIVVCMDARIDPARALGLEEGDAHVIRNAGGIVTDQEIRSLAISQRKLGTEEVMLIHHTRCGMLGFDDEAFAHELEEEAGQAPDWAAGGFDDVDADVRESVRRVRESPFLPHTDRVRGFVYEVETGRLREVT
jgi:carbonic anhydrase